MTSPMPFPALSVRKFQTRQHRLSYTVSVSKNMLFYISFSLEIGYNPLYSKAIRHCLWESSHSWQEEICNKLYQVLFSCYDLHILWFFLLIYRHLLKEAISWEFSEKKKEHNTIRRKQNRVSQIKSIWTGDWVHGSVNNVRAAKPWGADLEFQEPV